jgi:hypothetical protein
MQICICGGGSLAHVCSGVLASDTHNKVRLLTRRPTDWHESIEVFDPNGKTYTGRFELISSNPSEVIPKADIVLLCLPGYAIAEVLQQIKPFLSAHTYVGSIVCSTGFFFFAHEILAPETLLFGFQRVPFIARTIRYGESANLLGYKNEVAVAIESQNEDSETLRQWIEKAFHTPTRLLNHYYEVSLTNSNPILHTSRLYSMWKNWNGKPFSRNILFYREWTLEASEILIAMDEEFMRLLNHLPVDKSQMPPLLDYYESTDTASLTRKISSIKAFENILSPMTETPDGWIPDFKSRYFTEDFPYGLQFIKNLAVQHGVETPTIDLVLEWGLSKLK